MVDFRERRRASSVAWKATALGAAAIFMTAGWSPGARAETLGQALAIAVANSPDLDVQRAALRGLDEAVAAARAGDRPTVVGNASAGVNYANSSEAANPTTREPFSIGATISQNLYDGGQTRNAVESARASVKSGRFALIDTEQSVLLNAITAYARVLEAQENVRLARNNLELTRRTLQATRDRFEVGEVTRTDVAQAEAQVAANHAALAAQEGVLGQRRQDYIRFVGVAPGRLRPLPPLPPMPRTLEEAYQIAEQRQPAVMAAKADVEAASYRVRQAIGATLPQVDLTGDVSGDANSVNRGSGVFSASGALEVTVPIYSGGALRSNVRSAQAAASQARAQLQVTTRQALLQVGNAWEVREASLSGIRSNESQVRAQQVAYEGVREEAKVGSRTTLDVLEAEQALLDAQVALVGSRTDYYVNSYALMAAMGTLTIDELGVEAEPYDVQGPYESSQEFGASWEDDDDTAWRENWRP